MASSPSPTPKGLDLFSGAGGASYGYHLAGFEMTGVDVVDQPNYPFRFVKADALEYVAEHAHEYAFIASSPPCQAYSAMSACRPGLAAEYPALIEDVRELLDLTGLPYVIENVVGAPLKNPVMLCGLMFGRPLHRHRLFESNVTLVAPPHPAHTVPTSRAGHWEPGTIMSVAGHVAPVAHAREIMGMDWSTREELVEAVPPYFTEFLGSQLISQLERVA